MGRAESFSIEVWCGLTLSERREALVSAISKELTTVGGVRAVSIEIGPVGREYDLTVLVETDVGRLRTPLWSHARAAMYCDESIHPANRAQVGPDLAVRDAVDRLQRRLEVPYRLESRGLTVTLSPEDGVQRSWTAEHSRFRKRTAVVREDIVERAGDLDVRDLLAHFYTGPSLRLISDAGEPFLLPEAAEAEGPLVTLCHSCRSWAEGATEICPKCGSDRVDTVLAVRPPRR